LPGIKLALCILLPLGLVCAAIPSGVSASPAQPSPANNVLFLHYNVTVQKGWMNPAISDTNVTSFQCLTYGMRKTIPFPLNPGLNDCNCLVLNISTEWTARVHIVPLDSRTTATIVAGIQSENSSIYKVDGEYSLFKFWLSVAVLTAKDEISFSITLPPGGDIGPRPLKSTFYTDGSSNVTLPIIGIDNDTDSDGLIDSRDPDDDNDGLSDFEDAYPLDATRWARPEGSKPMPVWWYALPAAILLAAVSLAVIWKRRRSGPKRPNGLIDR